MTDTSPSTLVACICISVSALIEAIRLVPQTLHWLGNARRLGQNSFAASIETAHRILGAFVCSITKVISKSPSSFPIHSSLMIFANTFESEKLSLEAELLWLIMVSPYSSFAHYSN